MIPNRLGSLCVTLLVTIALLQSLGCGYAPPIERKLILPTETSTLDRKSPFLKAHMKDGTVCILSEWNISPDGKTVSGKGRLLDANRKLLKEGQFNIPIDSVALFETNVIHTSPAIKTLTIVTGVSVAVTLACAANPKACFGSCPTFYASDGRQPVLQAEGFSDSILPALERTDLDALFRAKPLHSDFEVRMRNEALETQVVRYVHLLAAPRPEEGRVFATSGGEFWQATQITEPRACTAPEGDCLPAVRSFDGTERFSTADPKNLATREILELEFDAPGDGELGLVIAARQSLLSTFLFYQTLGYMGRSAGEWLAMLERGDPQLLNQAAGMRQVLGGIEAFIVNEAGKWVSAGEFHETGPLAADVKLIPIPRAGSGPLKVQLRLTRGHWRLDYIALARRGQRVEPIRLRPVSVRRNGSDDSMAEMLLEDPSRALTTSPGDEYTFLFHLPEDFARYDLFLESRGYYLEWMRQEWLDQENPRYLAMMLRDPERALRKLAPEYKRIEPKMESLFWSSRYARP